MLRVGLTGGIGSGKSAVADIFAELGVPIIDADVIAREVTAREQPVLQELADFFGADILTESHELDRSKLRDIIFADPIQRKWLEEKLHPLIRSSIKSQIKHLSSPYCIAVIPLLVESPSIDYIDRVLVVDVEPDIQIARASQRDNKDPKHIAAIMQSQSQRDERLAIADDVIHNDSTLEALRKQVLILHQMYLELTEDD